MALTAPTGGAPVNGTNWAVVWVNGANTGSKVYTLSVAGQTVASSTTASTGPVAIPWNTASVGNGSHMLTASVRDAANRSGSVGRPVMVNNGGTAPVPLTVGFTSPAAGSTVRGTVSGRPDGERGERADVPPVRGRRAGRHVALVRLEHHPAG